MSSLSLTTSDPQHFTFLSVLENCCVPLPLSHELAVNTVEEAVPGCHSPLGGFLSALSDWWKACVQCTGTITCKHAHTLLWLLLTRYYISSFLRSEFKSSCGLLNLIQHVYVRACPLMLVCPFCCTFLPFYFHYLIYYDHASVWDQTSLGILFWMLHIIPVTLAVAVKAIFCKSVGQ